VRVDVIETATGKRRSPGNGEGCSKRRTIAQVCLTLTQASTGVLTAVGHFNDAIASLGFAVPVVSLGGSGALQVGDCCTPVQRIPVLDAQFLGRYGFSPAALKGDFDHLVGDAECFVVHSVYGYHLTWATGIAARLNRPVILVPHGSLDPYCFTYRAFRKYLWLLMHHRRLARVNLVCASDYEAQNALRYVKPATVHTVFWPVDQAPLGSQALSSSPVRQPRVLLFAGRLHPMKRVAETVQAFAALRPAGWTLAIAGPTSEEIPLALLEKLAGDTWGKSIVWLGPLSRETLAGWYRTAVGLVLLSHRENFANVVAEALTEGCPAFVSDRVGLASLVASRGAGLCFSIAGPNDVARALRAVVSLPHDVLSTMRGAAKSCADLFSPEVFKQRVGEILSTLLP